MVATIKILKSNKLLNIMKIKLYSQEFIQAILMSGRQCKKLNLLIELSNFFTKTFLKHIGVELVFKINYLIRFLQFEAIYFSSRCKKAKNFQGLYPLNLHMGSTMNPLQSSWPLSVFYNIWKLNLCSITDSKTAWINA